MADAIPNPNAQSTPDSKPGPTSKKRTAPGATVKVVTARGKHLDAEVTKVHSDKLVNLKFEHEGQEMEIHSSPYDPEGKQPDSWH